MAVGSDTSWLDEFAAKLTPDECEYLCTKLQEQQAAAGDLEAATEEVSEEADEEPDVMIPLTDDEEIA